MSRIAIVDRARVRVVDVERRGTVDLTAGADTRLANRQPSWSPDGARLAWSAFVRRQPDSPAAVAVATPEGSRRVDHAAVFAPFYLAWRPDGAAIATLSEGPLGLELTVLDARSGESEIVHRGRPLYFAWGADATLAVHHGLGDDARLDVWGAGYDRAAFAAIVPGTFSAPAVLPDGSVLAVVVDHDEEQLVVLDRAGTIARRIAAAEFGARIAVDDYGNDAIWVAGTDGSRPERLVTGSLAVWSPV